MFKIGIMTDSLKTDTKTAIKTAAELGAHGFQMYATSGENSPEKLKGEKRRELLDYTKSHGLVFSAICGDLGHGFGDAKKNPKLIEKSKRILELAKDFVNSLSSYTIREYTEDFLKLSFNLTILL